MLTDSRHLEKRPGQKGSTVTFAAFKMVLIFSAVTATSSSARIKEAWTQANSLVAILFQYGLRWTCKSWI